MSYGGVNLGGGVNGISPPQMVNSMRTHENALYRRILRDSWGTGSLPKQQNVAGETFSRVATPFRAVMNQDDYLSRKGYICGGPTLSQVGGKPGLARLIRTPASHCDTTGIQGSNSNPRFVADSSDFIRFKKMNAVNNTYNDNKFGGDQHNASQSRYMFAIHHK